MIRFGYCLICGGWSLYMWLGQILGRTKWMCLGCKIQRWIQK